MRQHDTTRARRRGRLVVAATMTAAIAMTSGCGIPRDPEGTLDRITGGVLRVGVSPAPGLVQATGGEPGGPLADLVVAFADVRDAEVDWRVDSEEDLVDDLEAGELDLAIGGMTAATPWAERVSVTRGYPGIAGSGGADVAILLPLGENALQSAIERFLDAETSDR